MSALGLAVVLAILVVLWTVVGGILKTLLFIAAVVTFVALLWRVLNDDIPRI